MKEIIIKGFKDKTANYLYGKEISVHSSGDYRETTTSRDVMTKLSLTDERLFNKKIIARTMYIPPIHMKTYNGTEYVLLMPWLNLINGVFDRRNLPWMQHVQSSIVREEDISLRIIQALRDVVNILVDNQRNSVHDRLSESEADASNAARKRRFNNIVNGVNDSVIPSWVLSALLFHNQLIHGRAYHALDNFHTMKDILKIDFKMGGRKINTMYKGVTTDNSSKIQFYNSLEMFLTSMLGDFKYNDNITNSAHPQSNFESYTDYNGRFIEFGVPNTGPMHHRGSIRLTDESQIIPLITPVIKLSDLLGIITTIGNTTVLRKGNPIINRDVIKFNVYNKLFNRDLNHFARTPISLRLKALRDRNIKALLSAGCNIDYIEQDSEDTNYLGGLTNVEALPTELTYENYVRSYTSIKLVATKHIENISGYKTLVGLIGGERISNVDVIDWLLKFGDTHVPLFNRRHV